KPALRDKLLKDKEMAYLSKKLVTLIVDAPLEMDFKKAKLSDGPTPAFVTMLRKLEFRTLLRQAEAELAQGDHANSAIPTGKELVAAANIPYKQADIAIDKPRVATLSPDASELWISVDPKHYSILPIDTITDAHTK